MHTKLTPDQEQVVNQLVPVIWRDLAWQAENDEHVATYTLRQRVAYVTEYFEVYADRTPDRLVSALTEALGWDAALDVLVARVEAVRAAV